MGQSANRWRAESDIVEFKQCVPALNILQDQTVAIGLSRNISAHCGVNTCQFIGFRFFAQNETM